MENKDGPNGLLLVELMRFECWGIEPALSLDNRAVLFALPATALPVSTPDIGGRNGLVDGVGRDVLGGNGCWRAPPLGVPTGEKREGTVPALALRFGLFILVSGGGIKSGKPS